MRLVQHVDCRSADTRLSPLPVDRRHAVATDASDADTRDTALAVATSSLASSDFHANAAADADTAVAITI